MMLGKLLKFGLKLNDRDVLFALPVLLTKLTSHWSGLPTIILPLTPPKSLPGRMFFNRPGRGHRLTPLSLVSDLGHFFEPFIERTAR